MKHHPAKDPFDTTRFHWIWGIVAVILVIAIAYFIYSPRRTVTESMQTPTPPPVSTIQTNASENN